MYFLSNDKASSLDWLSIAFNAMAVAVLLCALIPPYQDAKNKKMTHGLSLTFLLFYVTGSACVIFMSIINILGTAGKDVKEDGIASLVLFGLFILINSISLYLNIRLIFMKKANAKLAQEHNMTEEEYWEKHVKDTLVEKNVSFNNQTPS